MAYTAAVYGRSPEVSPLAKPEAINMTNAAKAFPAAVYETRPLTAPYTQMRASATA